MCVNVNIKLIEFGLNLNKYKINSLISFVEIEIEISLVYLMHIIT